MQPLMGFFIAALRYEITGELDVWTKMLVIVKTSMLNGCAYCFGHNTTLGRALGMTDEQTHALEGDYRNSDLFSAADKAAIAWAECLTERHYHRDKTTMADLKEHFNDTPGARNHHGVGILQFLESLQRCDGAGYREPVQEIHRTRS